MPTRAPQTASRRRGRPRSEAVHTALLSAALRLAGSGPGALTVDALAVTAGVSRQTIYRWWRSADDVLLEALLTRARTDVPQPDTGSLYADLTAFLSATFRALRGRAGVAQALRFLLARAQSDRKLRARIDRDLFAPRRAALAALLTRGAWRGELPRQADAAVLADMLFGSMWYRLLLGHAPLGDDLAAALAGAVVGTASNGF